MDREMGLIHDIDTYLERDEIIKEIAEDKYSTDELYDLGVDREAIRDWDGAVICYLSVLGKLQHRKGIFHNQMFLNVIEKLDKIIKDERLTFVSYKWIFDHEETNIYCKIYWGDYYLYGKYPKASDDLAIGRYWEACDKDWNALALYKIYNVTGDINRLIDAGLNGYQKALYELADWYLQTDEKNRAISVLKYIKTPKAYKILGDIYFDDDDIDNAIKMYGLATTSSDIDVDVLIGTCYYIKGDYVMARHYFNEEISKPEHNKCIYLLIADMYDETDDKITAFKWYSKTYLNGIKKGDDMTYVKKKLNELFLCPEVMEDIIDRLEVNRKQRSIQTDDMWANIN